MKCCIHSFFWVFPWHLNFKCRYFGTLCLFHLHKSLKKKNKWDKIAYTGKGLTQKKTGPIGRRRDRKGNVQVEERVVEGNSPKWRPVVRQGCKEEMVPCQSEEEEEPWDDTDLSIWFQEVVSFL